MSQPPAAPRRIPVRPALFVLLACMVIVIAAWSASSYPVLASLVSLSNSPQQTHPQFYAQVQIPKPTRAAPPASLPSPNLTDPNQSTSTIGVIFSEIKKPEPSQAYPDVPAPSNYGGSKYILVDISDQHLYAYQGEELVYSFVASTGINNATAAGTFSVLDKIPNAYGGTWNIWMPNWLGIYWAGGLENGIHALPILPNGAQLWAGFLGRPISYGCVVLGAYESQLLYDWAEIGTPVEIRW